MLKIPQEQINKFLSQFPDLYYWGIGGRKSVIPLVCFLDIPKPLRYRERFKQKIKTILDNYDNEYEIKTYIYALDFIGLRAIGNPIIIPGIINILQETLPKGSHDIEFNYICPKERKIKGGAIQWDSCEFYKEVPTNTYDVYMNEILSLLSNWQRIDYILFNNWEISQLYPYKEYKEEYELLTDTIKEVFNSKFYTEYPYELITYKLHN